MRTSDRRLTRAQFLRAVGGATGMLAFPRLASAATGRQPAGHERTTAGAHAAAARSFQSFRSRPDLRPPIVTVKAGAPNVATATQPADAEGYLFLAPASGGGSQSGLMVVDATGGLVWFRPLASGQRASNFMVQSYRGAPVLTWWEGTVINPPGYGRGEGMILNSSYQEVARVRAGHGRSADLHEFQLTPAGTALITCYPPTSQADLSALGGPNRGPVLESIIQEIDVQTGRVLLDWQSLEHIAVSESYGAVGGDFDYLHVNSIDVTPDHNLLISARHTWALYKLERRSGRVIWRMGGKRSNFRLGPKTRFSWQHDARQPTPDTITLFDDGAGERATESQSRGVVLGVDFRRRTINLDRAYHHPTPILTYSMGSMQQLSDGNVMVDYGSVPVLSEFSADGALISDLQLAAAQASYRGLRFPWSGTPTDLPAVAASSGPTTGTSTLYVSWNGATSVASWQVGTGPSPGSLAPGAVTPRDGFETAITVQSASGYAAVTALDSSGQPLATSSPVNLP